MTHATSPLTQAYGRALHYFRARAGRSQEDLSHEAGLHPTHIHKLEAGLTNPTLVTAARICAALGVSLPRFMLRILKELNNDGESGT